MKHESLWGCFEQNLVSQTVRLDPLYHVSLFYQKFTTAEHGL